MDSADRTLPAAFAATLLAAALGGCIGDATDPAPVATAGPEAPGAPQGGPMAVQVLTWEGYIKVSGAGEAPAHLLPTETAVEPVWKSGFNVLVEELPSVYEVMLDWTSATPSQVMFMTHAASDPADHREWTEFEYPDQHMTNQDWPTEGPICMRLPAQDLAPGHWHTMAHSKLGADLRLTFTVTTVGGKVSIPEGLHGHPVDVREAEEGAEIYFTAPWAPCELSGRV